MIADFDIELKPLGYRIKLYPFLLAAIGQEKVDVNVKFYNDLIAGKAWIV